MCRRHTPHAAGAWIEASGTDEVVQSKLRLSKPDVNPAAVDPSSREIGVQLQRPVNQLLCQSDITQSISRRPSSLSHRYAVVLTHPHDHPQKTGDFAFFSIDVPR